jgi:hypothetical protein
MGRAHVQPGNLTSEKQLSKPPVAALCDVDLQNRSSLAVRFGTKTRAAQVALFQSEWWCAHVTGNMAPTQQRPKRLAR